MKTIPLFTVLLAFAGSSLVAQTTPTPPPTISVGDYVTAMRADLKSGVVRIYSELMHFSDTEAPVFWTIYHEYEGELFKLGDRRIELIKSFVKLRQSGSWTNADAEKLAAQWLDLQETRMKLWKKYQQTFAKKMSPIRAAQFLYVEYEIALVIDLAISAELSLIELPKNDTHAAP